MIECSKISAPSRKEQLQTWELSETNKEIILSRPADRVKFSKEVQLFAACSHSEIDEVKSLLSKGVDINVVNVDGLSVLHQACIDNDYDLAKFLIENGANVNAQDFEGWTPLHVCASGSYTELAKLLLDNGASAGIVSFEMELPIDVAQGISMQALLQEAIQKQEVDAQSARKAEEQLMLEHANSWLKTGHYPVVIDSRTGATALHVAAAKDYCSVIEVLLKLPKIDIDAVDNDGWTPLHAAAHWAKERPLRLLASAGANFDKITLTNQSIFDVADRSVTMLLRQLRESQRIERFRAPEKPVEPVTVPAASRRRSEDTADEVQSKKQHKDDSDESLEKENVVPVDLNKVILDKAPAVPGVPASLIPTESIVPALETKSFENPPGNTGVPKAPIEELSTPTAREERPHDIVFLKESEIADVIVLKSDTVALRQPVVPSERISSPPKDSEGIAGERNLQESHIVDEKLSKEDIPSPIGAYSQINKQTEISPSRISEPPETVTSPANLLPRRVSAVLAPVKSEETEVQRSSKARQVRSSRRSTQGITNDVLEEAIRMNANESNVRVASVPTSYETKTAVTASSDLADVPATTRISPPLSVKTDDHEKRTSPQRSNNVTSVESAVRNAEITPPAASAESSASFSNEISSSATSVPPPSNVSRLRRVVRVPTGKINQSDVLAAAKQLEQVTKPEEQSPIPRPTSRFLRASGVVPDSSNGDRPSPSPIRQFSPMPVRNGSIGRTNVAINSSSQSPESGFSREKIDYKRLYEEERLEKDRLQRQLKNLTRDFEVLKKEYSHLQSLKSRQQGDPSRFNDLSPTSEVERLRQDNAKLSDDNKSLVRVISKLSSRS